MALMQAGLGVKRIYFSLLVRHFVIFATARRRRRRRNTTKMPSTHNADKPWDTEDVDKWKVITRYYTILACILTRPPD
jgi:hypothetical protein